MMGGDEFFQLDDVYYYFDQLEGFKYFRCNNGLLRVICMLLVYLYMYVFKKMLGIKGVLIVVYIVFWKVGKVYL